MLDRLSRALGWGDRRTAVTAGTAYLFMSLAFAAMGGAILRSEAAAMGPVRVCLFVLLLAAHTGLHWLSMRLAFGELKNRPGEIAYYGIQAGLIFALSLLTSQHEVILGLYVAMVTETAALRWPDWRAMALAAGFYIAMAALNTILVWGFPTLVASLPLGALLFGGITLFALLLAGESRTRREAEVLVQQLEATQSQLQEYAEQVEELTISQERQRMAREMHDTLAQGLAGVILQLEVADSHLEKDRAGDAQLAVQLAMRRARQTLHEARRAIQALRSVALEQKGFVAALAGEVSEFEAASGVSAELLVEGEPGPISPDIAQDLLRIIQESLSNVGRHAQASRVQVRLVQSGPSLQLVVCDNGRGFDVAAASQRPDCFGLQGMRERAQRIGAALKLESAPQGGTTLTVRLGSVPDPECVQDFRPLTRVRAGANTDEEASQ